MRYKVYWLSLKPDTPTRDYWDYQMLQDYFNHNLWHNDLEFEQIDTDHVNEGEFAVVVIPARHHADKIDDINIQINKLDRCILFLMGDEERDFDAKKIEHPNIEIWVMSPRPSRDDEFHHLGTGYTPHARHYMEQLEFDKPVNLFFSGQLTHKRRFEMWDNLKEYETGDQNIDINGTKGFTQGHEPKDYITRLCRAKIAPAPSGPETPDSFRLFEALEAMAVPLADELDPKGVFSHYWEYFFDDIVPFPLVREYDRLVGLINETLANYDELIIKQTAWWINYKRKLANKITNQIKG